MSADDQGTTTSTEPRLLRPQRRKPSPVWFGGLIVLALGLSATIILTYTLLHLSWQQRLGAWNYVAAVACIPVAAVLMRLWEPDQRLWEAGQRL